MALIYLQDFEAKEEVESSSVTETWWCDITDIENGYALSYPKIGSSWLNNNSYKCVSIQVNDNKKRGFFVDKPDLNGKPLGILSATYVIDYKLKPSVFSISITGSGYQTYKIMTGGRWGKINRKVSDKQPMYELKLPISQIDMSTTVIGELNEEYYDSMRGQLNSTIFRGRDIGRVIYDNYSIRPKYYSNSSLVETELTLTFKVLPIDWNLEWRNPMIAKNTHDGKDMYWQKTYPKRPDFTQETAKVGLPVYYGETPDTDALYGTEGWDYRVFSFKNEAGELYDKYAYDYGELNDLLDFENMVVS